MGTVVRQPRFFEIDGLPNFLRYGAPLSHFQRSEAPLKFYCQCTKKKTILMIHSIIRRIVAFMRLSHFTIVRVMSRVPVAFKLLIK